MARDTPTGSARPATIIDVATAAGVSRQTVTRALNDMADVSATTRERVLAAARVLNYRPNRAAQGLVRGRDVAIGYVVNDLRNPYYPELASELTRLAAERGWGVMLCDLGPNSGTGGGSDRVAALRRLETVVHRVDAIVGHVSGSTLADALDSLPTVIFDGEPAAAGQVAITIDYRPGIHAALDHLVAAGRRRIAMIDAGASSSEPSGRRIIYRNYLRDKGLDWSPASEIAGIDTHDGGITTAQRLVEQHPELDSVLVFNDVMALGALKGFVRAGRRVPDDVAVIGIDGLDIGTLVTPQLTSVALDKTELATQAIQLVDELLRGTQLARSVTHRTLTHTLIVRESA
jgi:LacI family transcriptional regulator